MVMMSARPNPDYGSMTLKDLRAELRKRNAKQSGRKHELVTRLESYDRNFNFGHTCIQCEDERGFHMTTPKPTDYKGINTDSKIPVVTADSITTFHELHGQDLQEKTEALYYGKFLQSVRYCNQDETVYFIGRVSAEMKTKVIYKVDIKINKHGVVEESQCECALAWDRRPTASM
ncbi:uncharacterized protein LOC119739433 [Patiria miniata]|uniref:SAP domain-containing protein n=1 Tax=Patiria miniata TaxID=46514 RepID=A0A914B2S9_PATMI|nr:uncharacterized protein LOC119739433 [Patiria miniata]